MHIFTFPKNQGATSLMVTAKSSWHRHFKMMEIERILNDAMVLPNINNGNPSRHNDDLCGHQIVILLEVVNDPAPCWKC